MVYNLLLEYGSGGTLADLIKKSDGKGLTELEVRYYTRGIVRGVNRIHECGFVHCDLKPENILLLNNPSSSRFKFTVKTGDFGSARKMKQSKKEEIGSLLEGNTFVSIARSWLRIIYKRPPSDIWALGCIVLEMFTGEPRWEGRESMDTEILLNKIGHGYDTPGIPNGISKRGKEFLKGCFSRKSMYRLTAEMLLYHSFVQGLPDDDERECEEDRFSFRSPGIR